MVCLLLPVIRQVCHFLLSRLSTSTLAIITFDNLMHSYPCLSDPKPSSSACQKNSHVLSTQLADENIDLLGHSHDTTWVEYKLIGHIANMLEQDITEVACSPWRSSVVLLKRKDGSTRFEKIAQNDPEQPYLLMLRLRMRKDCYQHEDILFFRNNSW